MSAKLVLASQSPRRRQLLALLGLEFEVRVASIDEQPRDSESPATLALRLAQGKAREVWSQVGGDHRVLGGDTVVALGSRILGKPENREQAVAMLQLLSGNTHTVYSAVSLSDETGYRTLLSESRVTFAELADNTIHGYCDTDDPYDKAGAYGIQGLAGRFVTRLQGSYSGVMGLPLWETHQLLMTK